MSTSLTAIHERQRQQPRRHRDEGQAHADGARRAPHPAEELLPRRQAADGQRDDQGVVAGQRQIDQDDPGQADPEFGVQHLVFPSCEQNVGRAGGAVGGARG
jgi:hypothetical protein